MTKENSSSQLALVLSGGGVRAMIFHLGLLRYLAEKRLLGDVSRISTVSGGSLLVGLILQEAGMRWPDSEEFQTSIYPTLRHKLCALSLQYGAARQLLLPWNWRFILSRANLLAAALREEWDVKSALADLPETPEWSINGTTAENGKRFRFKRESIGDYSLGYATPGNFPLASALAVSAAFPGAFGPLSLNTNKFLWKKRTSWGAPVEAAEVVQLGFKRLHIYDGGVYDNLGLEPFFDQGKCLSKHSNIFILVSDAGAPLTVGFDRNALNPWRLKRVNDIMSEQARALRVRAFMHYLQKDRDNGAYVYIGSPASSSELINGLQPADFPTTLRRVTENEFDLLSGHGYQVGRSALVGLAAI
ncbi:patatin-like phospholipase family protein [Polaromonas sp. A23]|uniref:patatin-like phospholipase family protein n=1 Tax=Polaromonas sp. A23 TaxID=1944133 RepID=UPI001C2C7122|nr:patatin-like phospholipase family protein [Polaromonas sp. A23]